MKGKLDPAGVTPKYVHVPFTSGAESQLVNNVSVAGVDVQSSIVDKGGVPVTGGSLTIIVIVELLTATGQGVKSCTFVIVKS